MKDITKQIEHGWILYGSDGSANWRYFTKNDDQSDFLWNNWYKGNLMDVDMNKYYCAGGY